MKFKHRDDWQSGKIDVGGEKHEIEDGVFEIDNPSDDLVGFLKTNGHQPITDSTALEADAITAIDGIGPARADDTLAIYDTVDDLIEAGPEEIADAVDGITADMAESLIESLK